MFTCTHSVSTGSGFEITSRPYNALLWFKYAVIALIFPVIYSELNFFICSTIVTKKRLPNWIDRVLALYCWTGTIHRTKFDRMECCSVFIISFCYCYGFSSFFASKIEHESHMHLMACNIIPYLLDWAITNDVSDLIFQM